MSIQPTKGDRPFACLQAKPRTGRGGQAHWSKIFEVVLRLNADQARRIFTEFIPAVNETWLSLAVDVGLPVSGQNEKGGRRKGGSQGAHGACFCWGASEKVVLREPPLVYRMRYLPQPYSRGVCVCVCFWGCGLLVGATFRRQL